MSTAEIEARASRALARFNELNEAGKGGTRAAEKAMDSAQYWLDPKGSQHENRVLF